jgi:hypothetical protein
LRLLSTGRQFESWPPDVSNNMIRNGLYSLSAKAMDGVDGGDSGVLVLRWHHSRWHLVLLIDRHPSTRSDADTRLSQVLWNWQRQALCSYKSKSVGATGCMSALRCFTDSIRTSRRVRKVPTIGIGGSLAAPPLPHHRTYGSVYGGSRSYANALRSRTGTRAI